MAWVDCEGKFRLFKENEGGSGRQVWQTAGLEIPSRSTPRLPDRVSKRAACGGGRVPMDLISNRGDGLEEGWKGRNVAQNVSARPPLSPTRSNYTLKLRFDSNAMRCSRSWSSCSIRGSEIVPPTPLFHARTKFDRPSRSRSRSLSKQA